MPIFQHFSSEINLNIAIWLLDTKRGLYSSEKSLTATAPFSIPRLDSVCI